MWIVELTKLNSSSNPAFHSIFRKLRKNKILKAKIGNIKFLLEIMKLPQTYTLNYLGG